MLFPYVTLTHLKDIYTVHGHCTSRGGHRRIRTISKHTNRSKTHLLLRSAGSSTGPRSIVPVAPPPGSSSVAHHACFDVLDRSRVRASPCHCALPCSTNVQGTYPCVVASTAGRRSITIRYTIYQKAASSCRSLLLRTGYNTTSRRFLGFCSAVPFRIIATNSL